MRGRAVRMAYPPPNLPGRRQICFLQDDGTHRSQDRFRKRGYASPTPHRLTETYHSRSQDSANKRMLVIHEASAGGIMPFSPRLVPNTVAT